MDPTGHRKSEKIARKNALREGMKPFKDEDVHPQTPFSQKSNMRGMRGNQVTHWPWHMLLNVFYYILEWAYGGKHKGWPNKPAACQSLLLSTRLTKLSDWPYIFLGHEPCVRFNKMYVNAIYKTECLCSDVKTVRDYDGEAVLFSGSRHGHLHTRSMARGKTS